MGFLDVGSEKEQVLRALQIVGDVPLYPWSIRQLSPSEEDRLVVNGVAAAALLPPESQAHSYGKLRMQVLPIEAQAIYNSSFPYGFNDGPIWAGKGVTGALSGGVAGRIGPLSFQAEPMVFEAQNQTFALMPTGIPTNQYLNGFYPTEIDLPQRFGDKAYRRFDPGQSTVRLDVGPLFADLSTADQWWGPALEEPLILGDNAPGFLHASVGSTHPINVLIGHVQGRVVWGRLEQSPYSPSVGPDSVRFMSGFVGSFTPRGIPGLELGATRFFHSPWPTGGFTHAPFGRPFEGILKQSEVTASNPTGEDSDNQLASIYARWVLPSSGVEVYGEYGREDHNINLRDLWQEPDHDAAYTVGLQRAWKRSNDALVVFRAEVLNSRISALEQGRPQSAWYVHGTLVQGHTDFGQLLAAPGGFGGSAANVALDWRSRGSRWTVAFDRIAQGEMQRNNDGLPVPFIMDVTEALSIEREFTRGATTLVLGGGLVWDLNRQRRGDEAGLRLTAQLRRAW